MFKFLSSVKLAVPLMLILAFCVAAGTIIESRFNAEYAKLLVYQTWWFYGLLALLWLNIFCATLSRWPFKTHHTGFVITHIGLLTLLIGAFVTAQWGIDGQLIVSQGDENNKVTLPETLIELKNLNTSEKSEFYLSRSAFKKNLNIKLTHFLTAEKYIPFSKTEDDYEYDSQGNAALKFNLKSPFFNVTQWLHQTENPELQMGPALFKLKSNKEIKKQNQEPELLILSSQTSKILAQIKVSQLKREPFKVGNVTIELVKTYLRATVDKSKLNEGPKSAALNPAIEILLKSENKTVREISYAKFPDFSLNAGPTYNLKFHYIASFDEPPKNNLGNIVEFSITNPVEVTLSKNNKIIEKKKVAINEVYQTPWMGIQITILNALTHAVRKTLVLEATPQIKAPLPPPAVLFNFNISDIQESLWLTLNQTQDFKLNNQTYSLFFGSKSIELPFKIKLNKFEKIDYPGTQTPKSFQSEVNEGITISMNEPLKKEGYTIYQASYILQDGMPPASVFSVNRDPGRPIKYLGSIILSIGIIVFTIMRSSFYKKLKKRF